MGTGEGGKGRKGGKGNGGNRGKEGRGGPGGDPRVYLKIFLRITYEIHRWRYTKFAKKLGPPRGGPLKKFSKFAIARHGGPSINLFVIPTLAV